eukprot:7212649-Pyramimonas_sp.AAC.1
MAHDTTAIQPGGATVAMVKELTPGPTPLRCADYWLMPSWAPSAADGHGQETAKAGAWKATSASRWTRAT